MLPVKLTYNGETRRVSLSATTEKLTFEELKKTAYHLFPVLRNKRLTFLWNDDECDLVCCSTNEEVEEATRIMSLESKSAFRFEVAAESTPDNRGESEPSQSPSKTQDSAASTTAAPAPSLCRAVHTTVTCDGCGMKPIVGARFKCTVREDFDLCERCEAKELQPYPTIKITNPSQAPVAILVAIRDENDEIIFTPGFPGFGCGRGGGRHGFRGHHGPHGPPGHPPHGPPPPPPCHGPTPQGGPECPLGGPLGGFLKGIFGGRHFKRHGHPHGRGGRKGGRHCGAAAGGGYFPAEAEFPESDSAAEAGVDENSRSEAQTEEEIVQAVLRLSMEEENAHASAPAPAPASAPVPVDVSASAPPAPIAAVAAPAPVADYPLCMKLVEDVTIPDGTTVQPGASFKKIWKIKNNGSGTWPEDTVVAFSGGDELASAENSSIAVKPLASGEETIVEIVLQAPFAAGRYVSYFRTSSNSEMFGQRLWADIRVTEGSSGWQVVNPRSSRSTSTSTTSLNEIVVEDVEESEDEVEEFTHYQVKEDDEQESAFRETTEQPLPETPFSAPAVTPASAPLPSIVVQGHPTSISPWQHELNVLNDMGFTNIRQTLPLLQQYVNPHADMSVRTEAFAIVMNALLNA